MDRISVTLPDETITRLSDVVDESCDNRSEAVRDLLKKGFEYDDHIADLERENERLRNEKRALIQDRDEKIELVEYVEEERSWREAGIGTRVRWWLFGKDD